ncbi:MAG: VWA domain-containing protein, partial [Chloroflexaceae bacterium]|nr:VWA domain-containing protein [Chloroflexaceae bacterium]
MTGEVNLRAALARPYLPATSTAQVAYVLLELQPTASMAQVRMPVNVSFVLDRSGSMKGDKIERVRRATSTAIDMLDSQDTLSVVIFDHRTKVLIPAG